MKKLKGSVEKIVSRGPASIVLSVIVSVLLVTGLVSAATTISTVIQTDGTLSVTGASTLTGAITAGNNITVPAAYGLDVASAGKLNLGTTTATTIVVGNTSATTTIPGGLGLETGTGSVSANAVTISKVSGVITDATDIVATSTRADITLNNTRIVATSVVLVSICSAVDTSAALVVSALPASGKATLSVRNVSHASQTSDYKICFLVAN